MNLYNKYRPKRFEDVAQPFVAPALKAQIVNGTHVTSYILSGPAGTGKTSIARIMAMALCCQNVKDGEPCGECDDCLAIIQDRHRDVIEHNCAVSGGVDDMRETIVANMRIAPIGDWRIFLLDECHLLTSQAQNSLLKTIEEPPPYVKFFLCTTEPHKVLTTIQTRCQHFWLTAVSDESIVKILQEILYKENVLNYDESALQTIAEYSYGSARTAIVELERVMDLGVTEQNVRNILGKGSKKLVVDLLKAIADENYGEIFRILDMAHTAGTNLISLLEESVKILLMSAKHKLKVISTDDESILSISAAYSGAQIMEVAAQLLETIPKIKQNAPAELVVPIYVVKAISKYKSLKKP